MEEWGWLQSLSKATGAVRWRSRDEPSLQ